MAINRRRLLQYTGASCALAALPALGDASSSLRMYEVRDAVALPRFRAGDRVVADSSVVDFAGAGLYLYPAWGQPRLYEVRAAESRLEFRNPGSGQLVWTQSANLDSAFAGRVLDLSESAAIQAGIPNLAVSQRPFTA
jgi:hypothetical protein